MHELRRISLMNWNLLEIEDIEVAGTTAFIGAVGVGKSTILDAIQTVLSGNQRSKISLNRAASVQKSARSVKEYCLGITEETIAENLVRKQCRSMIALSFYETELRHHYSIGVLLYADEDKLHAETEERWIAPGVDFSFKEFGDRDASGNICVLDPTQLLIRVRKAAGSNYQTFNATARSFVDAYLRGMRMGGGAAPNPESVLMRFRNAIAFEEIQNPTQFVRSFILDDDPIDADSLRANLHHWDTISAELVELQTLSKQARTIRNNYRAWGRHEAVKLLYELRHAWHSRRAQELMKLDLNQKIEAQSTTLHKLQSEKTSANFKLNAEADKRERKKDRERALENTTERAEARHQLETSETAVSHSAKDLTEAMKVYSYVRSLDDIKGWRGPDLKKLSKAGQRVDKALSQLQNGEADGSWRASVQSYLREVNSLTGILPSLQNDEENMLVDLRDLELDYRKCNEILNDIGKSDYFASPVVAAGRKALIAAGIPVTFLPDLVEIDEVNLPWAGALEAVLGAHRETIFIPSDRVHDAMGIISALSHPLRSTIHLAPFNEDSHQVLKIACDGKSRSIISIITTPSKNVSVHLMNRFGYVSMVDSLAEFDTMHDAVMVNGSRKVSGVYGAGIPEDLLLGSLAQRRRRDAARVHLEELEDDIAERKSQIETHRKIVKTISEVHRIPVEKIEMLLERHAHAVDELSSAVIVYEATSTPESGALRSEIAQHTNIILTTKSDIENRIEPAITEATTELIGLTHSYKDAVQKQQSFAEQIEETLRRDQANPYITYRLGFARTENIGAVATETPSHRGDDDIDRRRLALRDMTAEREIALLDALEGSDADYHLAQASDAQKARISVLQDERRREGYLKAFSDFIADHSINSDIRTKPYEDHFIWLCDYIERLEGSEIQKYEGKIATKTAEVHREVREMLVLHLNDRLERAQEELRQLNKRLRQHRFEGLAYLFTWSIDPEMRPLYRMARQVADDPNRANALLEDESDPVLKEAIETIRRIFSSDTSTQRFEDYRQYFSYEVRMTADEVTEEQINDQTMDGFVNEPRFIGTLSNRVSKGSGGQKQTPYYVAIAASMAAAYFPRAKKGDARGLGLVCFDEAFSKLDISNTQALLRFFRSLNLQVVVAAPEEKRASFMEIVDTIVDLYKAPGVPVLYIETKSIGPSAKDALIAANPEHVGIEGFRDSDMTKSKAAE